MMNWTLCSLRMMAIALVTLAITKASDEGPDEAKHREIQKIFQLVLDFSNPVQEPPKNFENRLRSLSSEDVRRLAITTWTIRYPAHAEEKDIDNKLEVLFWKCVKLLKKEGRYRDLNKIYLSVQPHDGDLAYWNEEMGTDWRDESVRSSAIDHELEEIHNAQIRHAQKASPTSK